MTLGLCRLRLPPDVFWALALPELAAMAGGLAGEAGAPDRLSRSAMAALMARFPD